MHKDDFWLSKIAQENAALFDKSILWLTLPYSHDAGAYAFPFGWNQIGPDCKIDSTLPAAFRTAAVVRQTQSEKVLHQLIEGGARELDLRICKFNGNPLVFYTEHCFLTAPLSDILNDVRLFMERAAELNMPEPVILNLSRFAYARKERAHTVHNFNDQDHNELLGFIEKALGAFLYRGSVKDHNLSNLTYKDLVTRDGAMKPTVYVKYRHRDFAVNKDARGIHFACDHDGDLGWNHLSEFQRLEATNANKGILLDCTEKFSGGKSQLTISREQAHKLNQMRADFFDPSRPRVRRFYVDVANETPAKQICMELNLTNLEKGL